jgi:hypothetical protein
MIINVCRLFLIILVSAFMDLKADIQQSNVSEPCLWEIPPMKILGNYQIYDSFLTYNTFGPNLIIAAVTRMSRSVMNKYGKQSMGIHLTHAKLSNHVYIIDTSDDAVYSDKDYEYYPKLSILLTLMKAPSFYYIDYFVWIDAGNNNNKEKKKKKYYSSYHNF